MTSPQCPKCGHPARTVRTQYGLRHDCCGLHSWDGKPLVGQAVHDARQEFHAAFDRLWRTAEAMYEITEAPGTDEHRAAVKRIRRSARGRAYLYVSAMTGLPEPDCHGAKQEDITKLRIITAAAAVCGGPEQVRDWYKSNRAVAA